MPTALVTGASSGIGAAFARALAARRYDLVLVARREPELSAIATELRATGVRVEVCVQDLLAPGAVESVVAAAPTIDLLVNNAGFGDYGPFADSDPGKQLRMVQLNVTVLVELTQRYLPSLLERGAGGIINVSSIAGFVPLPYMATYGATKAFVLSFSEALWAEVKDRGVTVLALCPGPTRTDFFATAGFDTNDPGDAGRAATPEEVVATALEAYDAGRASAIAGGAVNHIVCNVPRFFPREMLVQGVKQSFQPKSS